MRPAGTFLWSQWDLYKCSNDYWSEIVFKRSKHWNQNTCFPALSSDGVTVVCQNLSGGHVFRGKLVTVPLTNKLHINIWTTSSSSPSIYDFFGKTSYYSENFWQGSVHLVLWLERSLFFWAHANTVWQAMVHTSQHETFCSKTCSPCPRAGEWLL